MTFEKLKNLLAIDAVRYEKLAKEKFPMGFARERLARIHDLILDAYREALLAEAAQEDATAVVNIKELYKERTRQFDPDAATNPGRAK